jgi:hypothetical protein
MMRQMETSNSIAPNTANATPPRTNTETDSNFNVRLAFENIQENPDLKLRNNS